MPAPAPLDLDAHVPCPPVRTAMAYALPSGVCANTLPTRASMEAAASLPPTARRCLARRRIVDLDLQLPGPAVVLGQRSRTRPARAPPRPRRRWRSPCCRGAAGGRCGPARTPPPPAARHRRHAGLVRRLGVEAQRRERRPQPVRQVGHPLALGGPQLVDALGQQVERPGASASSGVGPGSARASPSPAASARAVPASSVASRVTERARRSAMTAAAATSARATAPSASHAVRTPSSSRRSGIRARTTDRSPPLTTTGV